MVDSILLHSHTLSRWFVVILYFFWIRGDILSRSLQMAKYSTHKTSVSISRLAPLKLFRVFFSIDTHGKIQCEIEN